MRAHVPDPWKTVGADPEPVPWAPIMLLLPDCRQRLEVRLHERRRDDDTGEWLFLIGAPLWQYAGQGTVEPAEYRTWVTAKQLEPIEGGGPLRRAQPPGRSRSATRFQVGVDPQTETGRPRIHHP
ncbi:hypothetical protein [Streptomyces sp. NPDC054901]